MNALKPREYQRYNQARRTRPKRDRASKNSSHQWLATEITIKLGVNTILAVVAVTTIIRLLPYQVLQKAKLQEIHVEVQETERRVDQLRDNFTRNFDPNQTKKVMQEQSPRIDPNQRRVFWVKH